MPKPKPPEAFDLKLTDDEKKDYADRWCRAIQDALDVRAYMIADGGVIDLLDWFYEQGRSAPEDRPFIGAADLTSYIITENVDALRARLMKAVFGVKPFCFAEGWGPDAAKAPMVEEFHDWQVRKSGLKLELAKTIHGALIEDGFILEVSEKIETRKITEELDAALEPSPDGGAVFDPTHQPKLLRDAQGELVPAQQGQPSATVRRISTKTKRLGPQYDAISMKDFVFLPGHARNRQQLWGYAYRFWSRLPELQEKVADGIYDEEAVTAMGEQSDRETADAPRPVSDIAPQVDDQVEKELFQLSIKADLDDDGREEWYLATLNLKFRQLLRLKLDTFVQRVGRPRCVPFILFPRRNSVYGYSYAGDKLLTLAEEHTALRNMKADRGALKTNAPMTVLQGALYDPDTQPFGVGRTITVRDHNEIKQLEVEDVPVSIVEQEHAIMQAKERVGGLADAAIGVLSAEKRTLGENRLVSGGSAVRVDEVIGHLHAAIAEVMALSHAIWVDALKADPKGLDAPSGVVQSLQMRGAELSNGKFTAEQLTGEFQFEPYGSAETADPDRRRADFNNGFLALANIAKVCTPLQAIFQNVQVAKALLEEYLRVYNVRDRQPFMAAFNQLMQMQASQPPMPAGVGPGMSSPAMAGPSGAPGAGGPPDIAGLLASLTGGGQPNVH